MDDETLKRATPRPWRYEFREMGGYDCMTDAYRICESERRLVADLDLGSYGQTWCGDNTAARPLAEANAVLIVAAVNQFEALRAVAEAAESVISASDGCVGHRNCNHSLEPWKALRAALKQLAEVERGS